MLTLNTNYQLSGASPSSPSSAENKEKTTKSQSSANPSIVDNAGQVSANHIRPTINGLTHSARHANDLISFAQTAKGALNDINNNLLHIRDLTLRAKNPTLSTADLTSIQEIVTAHLDEIDRIAAYTSVEGAGVFHSAGISIDLQVGANDDDIFSFTINGASTDDLGLHKFQATSGSLSTVDAAIATIETARENLGAIQSRFQPTVAGTHNAVDDLSVARSRDLTHAVQKVNDGLLIVHTAKGALNEINNHLLHIRDLTVRAKNATLSNADLTTIQAIATAHLDEIDRVAAYTRVNDAEVFHSAGISINIQVGANDDDIFSFTINGASTGDLGLSAFKASSSSLSTLDDAIVKVDTALNDLDAVEGHFKLSVAKLNKEINALSIDRAPIEDAASATDISTKSGAHIVRSAPDAKRAQAHQTPDEALPLLR